MKTRVLIMDRKISKMVKGKDNWIGLEKDPKNDPR